MKGDTRFHKIWLWIVLVGLALLMLSSGFGRTRTWNPVEQLIIEAAAPIQKAVHETVRAVKDLWFGYFYLVRVREDNRRLKKRIQGLRMEVSRNRELLTAHERLTGLLKFKQEIERRVLAAQVIGLDPTGWFKSVIIDKGKEAGLRVDFPVVNASGVVGRIVSVSAGYAKVLLAIDQNSAIDCLFQRSRDRGMVKGASADRCRIDYVVKSADVQVGDAVVTSGLGGVFPKGLPLGRVESVEDVSNALFKEIEMKPAVDFSKLEEVLIIIAEGASSGAKTQEK